MKQRAAVALRVAYGQGLETLFAFLCATLQAPESVLGWLVHYANRDLQAVVSKIDKWEIIPYATPDNADLLAVYRWDDYPRPWRAPERVSAIREAFGNLWAGFASEFLNQLSQDEYNSIKHGLRARFGPSFAAIGAQEAHGTPASDDQMHVLYSSEFGSSVYTAEKIGPSSYHFHALRYNRSWMPGHFVTALPLISLSLDQIVCYLLRTCYGVTDA